MSPKDGIDVERFDGKRERIAMEPKTLQRFAKGTAKAGALVVFEATGGYDRPLSTALAAAGCGLCRVDPRSRGSSPAARRRGQDRPG